MLQAASTWRHENASDDYKKITEITTSDSWSKDKLNVVDYVVSNVKFYRPSYTRNEIINISVCVAQNFLTVFQENLEPEKHRFVIFSHTFWA